VNTPLLVVPNLRLAAALERLVDAAGVTTNVALDLVPIGVDSGGTANGDGIVLLCLPLLLPPFGSLALTASASAEALAFFSTSSLSASAAPTNERAVGSISAASASNSPS
jgi:hypothetical protein